MKLSGILTLLLLASCAHVDKTPVVMSAKLIGTWDLKNPPSAGSDSKLEKLAGSLKLGGFSGLCCVKEQSGNFQLISISDRGPNEDPRKGADDIEERPFLMPTYIPEILISEWSEKYGWNFVERLPMRWEAYPRDSASGMPNSPSKDERPVDKAGKPLEFSRRGIDPEGIAYDSRRSHYWIVEEYGPSILKVDSKGRILNRWIPVGSGTHRDGIEELPAQLAERKSNRGFEGTALVDDTLYAFLQSPLAPDKSKIKVLAFNIATQKTIKILDYSLHDSEANKIGDVSALPDGRLLVLEQDGETHDKALRKIFVWNPKDGTKTLVVDLTAAGFVGREKVEGLTLLSPTRLAVVTDNDYAVKGDFKSELAIFEVQIPAAKP